MADRIVGFRESEWPAARDAINHVRRGALEHPFHRRIQPVLSATGSEIFRIDLTPVDECFGNRDSGGVVSTATGYQLLTYDVDGNPSTFETTASDLLFSWCRGIFFSGDYVECVPAGDGGKWRVISEGQSVFNQCRSATGGTSAVLFGGIAGYGGLPGAGGSGISVVCISPLTGAIADDLDVTVQWCARTQTFIINGAGC